MDAVRHTRRLALRHLRALWRQPAYVFITLVQPIIWLLLFRSCSTASPTSPASPAPRTSATWLPASS